jgi:solute carrier family 35 protein F5
MRRRDTNSYESVRSHSEVSYCPAVESIIFPNSSCSFLGVLLVTRSDSTITSASPDTQPDLPSHPVLGDFAALLSASFYAVYVVFLKVRVGDEDRADMQLMLG